MAMDWHACGEILSDLIDRERVIADELVAALAGEQDALRSVDPVALDAATLHKQTCVEQLARLDTERQTLCGTFGLSGHRDDMERLLLKADPGGSLTDRWQALLRCLDSCREVNEKNGVVLRLQKRRVTEALGILRGESANNAVYGNSGEIDDAHGRHLHAET